MDIFPIHNDKELNVAQAKLEEILENESDFSDEDEAIIQLLTIAICEYKEKNQKFSALNSAETCEVID